MKQYIAKSNISLRLYDSEGRSKLFSFSQDRNSYVAKDKWEEDVLDANLATGLYSCVTPQKDDKEPTPQQAEKPVSAASEAEQEETTESVAEGSGAEQEESTEAVAEGTGEVSVAGITTLHDMRKWLHEQRGIALDTLSNIQMIEKVAKEQKVVFPDYRKKSK